MSVDLSALSREALKALEPLLQAAYERGRKDTLAAIIAAANAPMEAATEKPAVLAAVVTSNGPARAGGGIWPHDPALLSRQSNGKAPRGLVPTVVPSVMVDKPFLTVRQIEDLVVAADERISPKSVGNELRRQEGVMYERDVPGGYRWRLIGQKVEAEGGDETKPSASDFNFTQGGAHGTTLATH